MGIMEKKMETTIAKGLGFRIKRLRSRIRGLLGLRFRIKGLKLTFSCQNGLPSKGV